MITLKKIDEFSQNIGMNEQLSFIKDELFPVQWMLLWDEINMKPLSANGKKRYVRASII